MRSVIEPTIAAPVQSCPLRHNLSVQMTLARSAKIAGHHVGSQLLASGIAQGPVFRRINVLATNAGNEGQQIVRRVIGAEPLTSQGVVAILRRRVLVAIDLGHVELAPGREGETVRSLSAHSFRVRLTQDLFAAGEDGAGIALALRWSSPTTALRYARELAVGSNAAARVLGKLRGTVAAGSGKRD